MNYGLIFCIGYVIESSGNGHVVVRSRAIIAGFEVVLDTIDILFHGRKHRGG